MNTLINVVDDLIQQKRQNLKYQRQELNSIRQRIEDEEKEIVCLQRDLDSLKNGKTGSDCKSPYLQ